MVAAYCEYVAVHVITQFHEIRFWVTAMTQVCETSLLLNVPRFNGSTNPLICVTGTFSNVSVNYSNVFVPK